MPDFLLNPGAPFAAAAVAGILIAAIGLMQMERARLAFAGVRSLPTKWGMRGRFVLGQGAGIPLAAILLFVIVAGGAEGDNRTMLLVGALAIYMYVGIIIPRKPIVQAQKERKRLRLLTPGFVSYVRVALAGYDPPATLLERYCARPARRLLPMQLMVVLALYPLVFSPSHPAAPLTPPVAAPATQIVPTADQEVLAVVAAYNQASITAAVLNKANPMAPYLAPDGQAWAEVQSEYQRRVTRGETHDPAMSRWGVLKIAVDGDTAMVETQEQWDDITSVGGAVVSSKRGILTRNTYALRRSPSLGRWLIMTVTSTLVIG